MKCQPVVINEEVDIIVWGNYVVNFFVYCLVCQNRMFMARIGSEECLMGKKVLDDTAIFSCSNGIGVTFSVEKITNQKIARGNHKEYLNAKTKCKLNSSGQCTCQPNPSGAGFMPCSMITIPGTSWINTDSIICINGAKALVENSFTNCPMFQGKISLQGMSNSIFKAGCDVSFVPLEYSVKQEQKTAKKSADSSDEYTKRPVKSLEENVQSKEKQDTKHNQQADVEKAEYARCYYETCGRTAKCPYYNAKPAVVGDSQTLERQFKRDRAQDYEKYVSEHEEKLKKYKNIEECQQIWKYQAHHIISTNQVFMAKYQNGDLRYGHLLKLANLYGYDINNANNCILLPSKYRKEDSWKEKAKFEKAAKAFDVMDIMKRQWHLGTHDYTISKDSLKYYKPPDSVVNSSQSEEYFPNYATSVKAKLDILAQKYSRKKCWANYMSSDITENFINDMNQLSREIENYLLAFEKKPKNSYPFFVSKVAVEYAYDAPKTGKVIFIYKGQDGVYASKFRVSRKQKDNYNVQVIQNETQPQMRISNGNMKEFVRYCENVMHFWIDENSKFEFPWNVQKEYIHTFVSCDDFDLLNYANDNKIQLFAFIDQNEIENQGQLAQIRKRLQEVREYNGNICS